MARPRTAFFVSDRTGITAEMLGHSLLTQFDNVRFNEVTLPFVDTVEKAREVVAKINEQTGRDGGLCGKARLAGELRNGGIGYSLTVRTLRQTATEIGDHTADLRRIFQSGSRIINIWLTLTAIA